MRFLMTGFVYFAIVFGAGFVFGVLREMVLTPVYGKTLAIFLEAPFMFAAIIVGAWIAVHRNSSGWSKIALLAIGLTGIILVQVADFGVGLGLRGMSLQDQFAYLQTVAGQLYLGLLTIFTTTPLLMGGLIQNRAGHSLQTKQSGARDD